MGLFDKHRPGDMPSYIRDKYDFPENDGYSNTESKKERLRAQYCKKTWSCPHCGWTNYGGERCNGCGNGNPNIPPNLW